jgi:hypothetical protein
MNTNLHRTLVFAALTVVSLAVPAAAAGPSSICGYAAICAGVGFAALIVLEAR